MHFKEFNGPTADEFLEQRQLHVERTRESCRSFGDERIPPADKQCARRTGLSDASIALAP